MDHDTNDDSGCDCKKGNNGWSELMVTIEPHVVGGL